MTIRSWPIPTRYSVRATVFILCSVAFLLLSLVPARAAGTIPPQRDQLVIANVQVSHDSALAHSEPAVAENPKNPKNLIAASKFFSNPARYVFKIGTFYSMNGGRTWHDSGLLPGLGSYAIVSDVSIAFAPSGIAYATVLACSPVTCDPALKSGIFVFRSNDGGKTWSQPITVFLDSEGSTLSDKPWIAVDGTRGPTKGDVYIAWNFDGENTNSLGVEPDARRAGALAVTPLQDLGIPSGMVVARSTDYGKTWSLPVLIHPFNGKHFALGAIPAVAPDGHLWVAYFARRSTSTGYVDTMDVVSSADGGVTFSKPRAISGRIHSLPNYLPHSTFRNFSLPTFAISPRDGALVVAWADMRNGDADVLEVHSNDGGQTWSAPVRVNHDPLHNRKDQFMPALAASPDGTFTCAWFDRRHDKNGRLIDEDVAQSRDGGRTFGVNLRVTKRSWDPAIGAPHDEKARSETFIGDYQGLAADNTTVHPLWNDTQDGKSQQIRTAVIANATFLQRERRR